MAPIPLSRYFKTLCFFILYFKTLTADHSASFYFKNFGKSKAVLSNLALFGDSKVVNGGSSIQISGSNSSIYSAGRVMRRKPMKFVEGNPEQMVSFSTYFSFSISPENGDGFAFVMVPSRFPLHEFKGDYSFGVFGETKFKLLGVEFDTSMDKSIGDLNDNHVGIDFISPVSIKTSNVSEVNLVLKSGKKLQAWIDYEAGSNRIEVRLSKFGEERPVSPLLFYPVNLSRMWNEEQVFVGLSSSNKNSSQKIEVHSWSFKLRKVPHWLHSQPLDPQQVSNMTENNSIMMVPKNGGHVLRVVSAFMFAVGCGVLGAFIWLFMWTMFMNRLPVVPEEQTVQDVEFDGKKVIEAVDKDKENGKK